ncbi:DUF1289 domain-containing protein [Shewanella surugensis]|uniref:DUF1289 domain-containing protein n=1 Tax=Shewanella surugensis TaxID=212020 RepID=A0ABT0L7P4_9GAMM|nr:DUF1289 domain-containing protein [Shewanella surugensis]MCL1123719.1 DUF1289 domain-containing protein [Shewanella surugensis]
MDSPCVAHCGLNQDDFCMGCFRHIDEIVTWNEATNKQKSHIIAKLPLRKTKMQAGENTQLISRKKWLATEKRLK